MRDDKILYIVVPCYNEEEVLPESSRELKYIVEKLIQSGKISNKSKILFVNDGSKDKTWEIIEKLHSESKYFTGICLSRNRGHQNAVLAGMHVASNYADMIITIDADLQDDPVCISQMVDKYHEGYEVVSGVRNDRKSDTFFKRVTAQAYYKIMKWMGVDLIYNSADCRLLSKRATKALMEYKEVNLFLRGLVPLIGFKSTTVEYQRNERKAGESKYGLKQMLHLAGQGITSFSLKPIKFIRNLGIFFLFGGLTSMIVCLSLINYIPNEYYIALIINLIFVALGFILLAIYIVGEYVGKIYLETKERPKFFLDRNLEEE
jgi:glycosyltransferase involved in cell wall biosynthesis